jgi:hypothetical protein
MNDNYMSDDVKQAYQLVTNHLGKAFSFEQLLTYIDTRRVKPRGLHVVELHLKPGVTGYALGLVDADVIGVRTYLDMRRYLPVRLHEGAHFLLKHVPKISAGAEDTTLHDFMQLPDLRHALLRDRGNSYDQPHERAAEHLARLLLKCINRYNNATPSIARDIYL